MGRLGRVTYKIHLISAKTSQEGSKCTKAKKILISNDLTKVLTVLTYKLCLDCRRKIVPMAELSVGRQAANSSRQMLA